MMANVWDNKFCQVHIPKTGGKWARTVLREAGMKITHRASDNHEPAPPDWPHPTFVFIRHPATWLASWWAFCQRNSWRGDGPDPESFDPSRRQLDWMRKFTARHKSDDFEEFVHSLEEERPGFVAEFYGPYMATANLIGKTENLERDLKLCVGRALPSVEPVNVAPNRPEVSEEIVRYIASKEPLERLGYD